MTSNEYDQHQRALDERIIGYGATYASTGFCVAFDRAIVVQESDAALQEWLKRNGITDPVSIRSLVYAGNVESLHEEGVQFFFDSVSLQRFHSALAQDLRFKPATEEWESDLGTLVEPVYNIGRDSAAILKDQLDEATVGFHADDAISAELVRLFNTENDYWAQHPKPTVEPVRLTWSEYLIVKECGFAFSPDTISQRLLKQMAEREKFCEIAMENELE